MRTATKRKTTDQVPLDITRRMSCTSAREGVYEEGRIDSGASRVVFPTRRSAAYRCVRHVESNLSRPRCRQSIGRQKGNGGRRAASHSSRTKEASHRSLCFFHSCSEAQGPANDLVALNSICAILQQGMKLFGCGVVAALLGGFDCS
ncbi:hypothetical protein BC567DRAFT_228384 [Phyllosticta citribraziliensis]